MPSERKRERYESALPRASDHELGSKREPFHFAGWPGRSAYVRICLTWNDGAIGTGDRSSFLRGVCGIPSICFTSKGRKKNTLLELLRVILVGKLLSCVTSREKERENSIDLN